MKGISLIVEENDTWNIYFPFDDCHRVNLKREGEPGDGIDLNHPGQRLDISVSSASPAAAHGTNYTSFFDVNHHDAHSEGIKLKDDWSKSGVRLTVAGGSYSATLSEEEYFLRKAAGGPKTQLGRIGTVGTLVLSAEAISLSAEGEQSFTWSFPENATIVIDNDCHNMGGGDPAIEGIDNNKDFKMIYQLIEDAKDPTLKFEIQNESGSSGLPCNQHRTTKPIQ